MVKGVGKGVSCPLIIIIIIIIIIIVIVHFHLSSGFREEPIYGLLVWDSNKGRRLDLHFIYLYVTAIKLIGAVNFWGRLCLNFSRSLL